MARIYPLYSSSKGNSTFIGTEKGGILIDCGVSCKRIIDALDTNNIPAKAVRAVFITHEHSDHISGLRTFTEKTGCYVYAQEKTLKRLINSGRISPRSPIAELEAGKPVTAADMEISCFNTPHDTIQSCGYRIRTADDKVCAVCTDLGHITEEVHENLNGCQLVLLEANYDEGMLRTGVYPFYLKERILSPKGHLSNEDCAAEILKLIQTGTFYFLLGHLSQDNNTTQIAARTVNDKLVQYIRGRDYLLGCAPVETLGGAVIF